MGAYQYKAVSRTPTMIIFTGIEIKSVVNNLIFKCKSVNYLSVETEDKENNKREHYCSMYVTLSSST